MTANTNPLSYNAYIQHMGVMAVVNTVDASGVWQGVDPAFNNIIPNMLNYAELRIQRDLDMLAARTNNAYTMIAGNNTVGIPADDFITIELVKCRAALGPVDQALSMPMVPVSLEFIATMYSALSAPGTPRYFALTGDNFGDGGDTFTNIVFGPTPNFAYPFTIYGLARAPSLYKYAVAGPADTSYTYISSYYPDLLVLASMIYISMFQRNFGVTGDDPASGMTYEKQYQIARIGAIAEENRRKQMGSSWTAYSTPVSATPTR